MEKEIVLITGASRGMGQHYSRYFAEKNYDLLLVAKPNDGLIEFSKTIKNAKVYTEEIDLTNMEEIGLLYKKYKDFNITVVINNAGFGNYGSFYESNLQKQLAMVDLNVKALHANSHYWANKFVAQNKGLIVNIASIAAFLPGPYMPTYFATKSYVRKITKAMNWEFKYNKKNVRAVIICPGPIATDFWNISSGTYEKGKEQKLINKSFLPVFQPKDLVYKAMDQIFKHKKRSQVFVGFINKRLPLFERFFPEWFQMRVAKKFNDSQKPSSLGKTEND